MKKTIVLLHPSGKIANVKIGFCWPAFLFGPLWAVVKRLWWHFAALVAVLALINFVSESSITGKSVASDLPNLVISLAYMLICGVQGNYWLRTALFKRGYREISSTNDQTKV